MESLAVTPSFWHGRSVLVTGHTGFKRGLAVSPLGAPWSGVAGFSVDLQGSTSVFEAVGPWPRLDHHVIDIRQRNRVIEVMEATKPEVVFHLAARSLFVKGTETPGSPLRQTSGDGQPAEASLRSSSVRSLLVVTSDKVYTPSAVPHSEQDPLGGFDPYSGSKAAASCGPKPSLHSRGEGDPRWDCSVREHYRRWGPREGASRAGRRRGGGSRRPDPTPESEHGPALAIRSRSRWWDTSSMSNT